METNKFYEWSNIEKIAAKQFTCGYCGSLVASDIGYFGRLLGKDILRTYLYICPYCSRPTFFELNNEQIPGPLYGSELKNIEDKQVYELYNEARRCFSSNCYTAAVICCRKLLMNIAVSKGASKGLSFGKYVDYLLQEGYIPINQRKWVDHIRQKGNEANHEIELMKQNDAEELIDFTEMLLKIIFEYPETMKKKILKKKDK